MFGMSLPTLNNQLARVFEPKAPAPIQRLETLRAARAAGLKVFVAMAPTYPDCDEKDLKETLTAIRALDPITIFHEPINIRAENVERIERHAADACINVNTEAFSNRDTWRQYAIDSLMSVEHLATELGLLQCLHLWPDKQLGSKLGFLKMKKLQRVVIKPTMKRGRLQIQKDKDHYDLVYRPWLDHWWNRISEWPGKK